MAAVPFTSMRAYAKYVLISSVQASRDQLALSNPNGTGWDLKFGGYSSSRFFLVSEAGKSSARYPHETNYMQIMDEVRDRGWKVANQLP
jgi:hypothetical protein